MAPLRLIISRLEKLPGLIDSLDLHTIYHFIELLTALKSAILHHRDLGPSHDPARAPAILPADIATYTHKRLDIPLHIVTGLWTALAEVVWTGDGVPRPLSCTFRAHDQLDTQLAYRMLYPPVNTCVTCGGTSLLRHKDGRRKVSLFTLAQGVCDALSVHLYCYTCNTNHHHNYAVQRESRIYYPGVPDIIQVAEHTFIERRVLELFRSLALFSWTSATNAANVYDHALAQLGHCEDIPARYRLRTEHVWDGFVLLSLLKDAERQQYVLEVPHTGDQRDRFTKAMSDRNAHIHCFGQEEFNHFCDKCHREYQQEDGSINFLDVVVTDGIEMGRPCCSVRHCTEALLSTRDRYCPSHRHLTSNCVIEGCTMPIEPGYKTCSDPQHRNVENWHNLHGKAMFNLRRHLLRSQPGDSSEPAGGLVSGPMDNVSEDLDVGVEYVVAPSEQGHGQCTVAPTPQPDRHSQTHASPPPSQGAAASSITCPDKPSTTSRTMRAMFGRRRTHNEQFIIRPCGIIVKRATFYGSETTPQVLDLLRKTWPDKRSMPRVVIYDNGCGLYKHSEASGETLHLEVGLPVDVFHWKCKHKQSDEACSVHCNPLCYPELLLDDKGNWFFNSSIAEQTNVWGGGYGDIIREMVAVKHDFFLDEMVHEKNRLTRAKLVARGGIVGYRPHGLTSN
ncbi:hypothetical protein OH77DRAFT_1479572 [Trametes cingulata]|nr:hypothetical protein OH77DRAFT_1479572 [Trametes cingulata]